MITFPRNTILSQVSMRALVALENPIVDRTIQVSTAALTALGDVSPGSHVSLSALPLVKRKEIETALIPLLRNPGTRTTPGGAALNSCRVAAWCGAQTAFIGAVGDDEPGRFLREACEADGVTALLQVVQGKATATCTVLVDETAERTLLTASDANWALQPSWLKEPSVAGALDQAGAIYVTTFALTTAPRRQAARSLAQRSLAQGAHFALNLGSSGLLARPDVCKEVQALLPMCSLLFGNAGEIHALMAVLYPAQGSQELSQQAVALASRLAPAGAVLVTDGPSPVHIATAGEALQVPVPELGAGQAIVDTNGAGDAFVGGFLASLLQVQRVESSLADRYAACVLQGMSCSQIVIGAYGCTLPPASI